jgi:hypothetical protein
MRLLEQKLDPCDLTAFLTTIEMGIPAEASKLVHLPAILKVFGFVTHLHASMLKEVFSFLGECVMKSVLEIVKEVFWSEKV